MPSVSGDVDLMPVSDVALWMGGRAMSGTLTVRRRGVESRFTIRSGSCTRAASLDPREYLGQHLINFGYLDEEQLQRAFDTQRETHVPLGRVLVMVEAITTEQLQRVLTFKTREGLLEALCWKEGQWKLTSEVDPDRELDCDLPVDLREVSGEATARQQMWTEIRRVFATDATRVDVLVDPATVESAFDRRLLLLMHTGASVGEAALELRAMDFQTYARLYDLASRNLVRPKQTTSDVRLARAPPNPTLSPLVPLPASGGALPPPAPPLVPTTPLLRSEAPPVPALPSGHAASSETAAPTVLTRVPTASMLGLAAADPDQTLLHPPRAASAPSAPGPPAAPRRPTPPSAYFGAGSYMMMKPENEESVDVDAAPAVPAAPVARAVAPPNVMPPLPVESPVEVPFIMPLEATDPEQALRLALAGRDWSEALLMSQRILERDPLNSEAIAAYRVAEVQLRRREKDSPPSEPNFNRVPLLRVPREEIAMGHLSSKERYVLSRVDSKRTLGQIAAVSPIQRAELARIVDAFVQRGVLTLV